MTDNTMKLTVVAASSVEVDRKLLNQSISEFVVDNPEYYTKAFRKIHDATLLLPRDFNIGAAVFGPLWAASRAVWGMFWTFLVLEVIAWVQIGRGAWGDPGAKFMELAARQQERAASLFQRASEATTQADADRFQKLGDNITRTAENAIAKAQAAQAETAGILMAGIVMLVVVKLVQGLCANIVYERQYSRWRIDPAHVESGVGVRNAALGLILFFVIMPLVVYKFTTNTPLSYLDDFPEETVSAMVLGQDGGTLYAGAANWLESKIDAASIAGDDVFSGIVHGVRTVLDTLAVALIGTPWPAVMLIIIVMAWRSAGARVAVFTTAALAYIALLGYWSVAMETVALVGAAVLICVVVGIPLGIWFGKSLRSYKFAEPVLDLMQTLPAFVYLIPIIAFFGTGNPPGILATIIFGMPPVIRLTALGMRGVPDSIKEAASAYGASRWQLLKDVEIPLALPSIMTGVNQTILMCLSMVVIISLIGGGGLGKDILEALQYAAKGPGLLGGFAILFVAMVIDRILQGAFKRPDLT